MHRLVRVLALAAAVTTICLASRAAAVTPGWASGQVQVAPSSAPSTYCAPVAVSRSFLLVGCPGDDEAASQSGVVYLFESSSGRYKLQQKTKEQTPSDQNEFGFVVSLWQADLDSTSASAAHFAVSAVGSNSRGVTYVYKLVSDAKWALQETMTAQTPVDDGEFGAATAIDGDTLVIGSPGVSTATGLVQFYTLSGDGASWTPGLMHTPPDAAVLDRFGSAVAVSGITAAVGSPQASSGGAVYLFRYQSTSWVVDGKVIAASGTATEFGSTVAVASDYLLVGSKLDTHGAAGAGAVYVFRRQGASSWSQLAMLQPEDSAASQAFGTAVAMDLPYAVIGAEGDSSSTGAAYVYTVHPGIDSDALPEAKLVPASAHANDQAGQHVAIAGNDVVLGAPYHDATADASGAVFAASAIGCPDDHYASEHDDQCVACLGTGTTQLGYPCVCTLPWTSNPANGNCINVPLLVGLSVTAAVLAVSAIVAALVYRRRAAARAAAVSPADSPELASTPRDMFRKQVSSS